MMDLVGLDVNLAVSTSVYEQTFHDRRFRPSVIQRDLVDAGRLGRKTGSGFYDYRSSERPAPAVVEPARIDGPIEVRGDLGWAGALVDRWTDAGTPVEFAAAKGTGTISVGGVIIVPTRGRTAGRVESGGSFDAPVVVLDLFRPDATGVAIAAATSSAPRALPIAAGALDAAGLTAIRVEDVPGLILMRIVAQLASVAADAVSEGVATPGDIDIAMRLGTNYPAGPLEWADELGVGVVVEVLDAMYDYYRDERYAAAGSLRRAALEGRTISGGGRET